ncbi:MULTISPECIES: heme exporter protein CcmD [Rhodobacterales]|jgi:heme exporter protein D|uniref:Heme exporter protein D n=1 Tax=Phaeobacter gallaeciensis TaxID=60890 RepID=A0A1B0ZMI6_9RHOB|nr:MULTISPECIES: heme exporter protein CcmD [Phaeobacter]MDF1771249.1 heme exporter protein CcmD [Pseudophaeobacter sp. bin_em_oilr2.035]ANP35328.1 hemagglutination activity protein [Phaeobacter gallaeciensis]MDE4062575.1 heme exporter protein CcmD [Phaeobacter gallaeciensis]MDE4125521.1 heme exporter protein CcmD [Phaeobacter gallaeciensis]MDE4130089.1 heme exporter protein CcmD [Phaeobacter gallaeciensis]
MMPDLGKYSETVLSSYAASILLLVLLVAVTLWRGRRVRAEMERLEQNRVKRNG